MNDRDEFLEREFDFSKAVKNPYARELKKQVTIKISPSVMTEEEIEKATQRQYRAIPNE